MPSPGEGDWPTFVTMNVGTGGQRSPRIGCSAGCRPGHEGYPRTSWSTSKSDGNRKYPTITSVVRHRATTTRVNRSPGQTAAPTTTAAVRPIGSQGVGSCTSPSTRSPWHTGFRSEQPQRRIATRTTQGHHTRSMGSRMEKGSRQGRRPLEAFSGSSIAPGAARPGPFPGIPKPRGLTQRVGQALFRHLPVSVWKRSGCN